MKLSSYIIFFVLIVVGCFCGIGLYKDIKAESYVVGSIDITNQFEQESFNYTSTSLVFYHDIYDQTNTYIFEKDLLKVVDFNGQNKQYKLELNDFSILDCNLTAGAIHAPITMDFYNTDGELVCSGLLNISIKFLSNKTTLTIITVGEQQKGFFEQYFADNGIRLKVVEIL